MTYPQLPPNPILRPDLGVRLPDGSPDYRMTLPTAEVVPVQGPDGKAQWVFTGPRSWEGSGAMAWLREHQTAVMAGAAALLLLAFLRRRR
ncbi:MAG TPA: hypothetical protein DEH78_33350 [Solibacterales bacterium]|nr:hypothetical protein [Bryobacterales bacterium]